MAQWHVKRLRLVTRGGLAVVVCPARRRLSTVTSVARELSWIFRAPGQASFCICCYNKGAYYRAPTHCLKDWFMKTRTFYTLILGFIATIITPIVYFAFRFSNPTPAIVYCLITAFVAFAASSFRVLFYFVVYYITLIQGILSLMDLRDLEGVDRIAAPFFIIITAIVFYSIRYIISLFTKCNSVEPVSKPILTE